MAELRKPDYYMLRKRDRWVGRRYGWVSDRSEARLFIQGAALNAVVEDMKIEEVVPVWVGDPSL